VYYCTLPDSGEWGKGGVGVALGMMGTALCAVHYLLIVCSESRLSVGVVGCLLERGRRSVEVLLF
jgi:hypothetical protein